MKYRIYVSDRDEIISGYVNQNMLENAKKHQEFFRENNKNQAGKGIFELELPHLKPEKETGRKVVLRATADKLNFGVYGYEGWEPIIQDYTVENNGCTVIFDRMIMYYICEYREHDEYHKYLSFEEASKFIDKDDRDAFEDLLERYIEDRKSE